MLQVGAVYRAMGLLTTASPCALVLVPMAYVAAIAAISFRYSACSGQGSASVPPGQGCRMGLPFSARPPFCGLPVPRSHLQRPSCSCHTLLWAYS